MKKICIVSSCYNEEGNIEELYNEILKYIQPLDKYEWEMLFEYNCSTDNTEDILLKLS